MREGGRRRTTTVSAAVLAMLALVVTAFALRHPGLTSSEVEVGNGGVWITNRDEGLMGRLNVDAREFDARLAMVGDDLDILQAGYTVLESGARGLTPVNTAAVSRGGMVELPAGSTTDLGGDRVAITAPDGRVWILSPEQAAAFSPAQGDPAHETGGTSPAVTVTDRGTVMLLDGDQLLTFERVPEKATPKPGKPATIGGVSTGAEQVELTAVGETPVVLDRENRLLRIGTEAKEVDLTPAGIDDLGTAVLQQPSPDGRSVLLSTPDSLVEVPLDGGRPTVHGAGGTGTPAAPVQAAGCRYGVWNGSLRYLRVCGDEDPDSQDVPEAESGADLVLRRNRDLVVLNDQESGMAWMASEKMQLVADWNITQDIQTTQSEEVQKETLTSTITDIEEDRDQDNRPPVAHDDEFGVRAGQNIVLPVVRNDTDPDGDLLTVQLEDEQPGIGTVSSIRGGTQLQIAVDPEATGTAEFTYRAEDGRTGEDTATVRLRVSGEQENSPPEASDQMITRVQVRSGEEVSLNILPYWQDPDGDAFYLANATIPPEDLVSFRPDGMITIDDAGLAPGTKPVALTFRDEHGATAEGILEVESVTDEDLVPVTTDDHLQVVSGRSGTLRPLVNDIDPGGNGLELTNVSTSEGLEVEADLVTGSVTVTSSGGGTHYLEYTVASGAASSTGLIRVDVVDPSAEDLVPVAVDDMALVTVGTHTLVDPLENDVDPTGGVLVVNSVQVPPDSGLKATVLSNHLLRIEAEPDATVSEQPVALRYEVANASGSTEGTVRVTLARTDTQFANPVARPDEATVRAGDMVMVDVLENDISPTGATLRVTDLPDTSSSEDHGHAEIHQDRVRFSARPGTSGEAVVTYEVTDDTGRVSSARLTLRVIAEDAPNAPPRPLNLEARTVAGSPVRIPVSTTGVDPDGDSVMLMGITSPVPQLGEVTSATGEWIEYTPFEGALGTDRLRYQVMDRYGAIGTAEVLVGVALPSAINQPPFAVDDVIEVRPQREVQIPVLDNDSDPEGATLRLVHESVESATGIEVVPPAEDEGTALLTVRTPEEPGTHTVLYEASDGQLATAAGVTVTVDPEAEPRAPIASDDFVPAADVLDPQVTSVAVDLLANDRDPDGTTEQLTVELVDPPEGVTLREGGGVLDIVPADDQQRIRYVITDVDSLTSAGYVWIPGKAKQAPVWVGESVQVVEGSSVQIDLTDPQLVRVRPGGTAVRITDPGSVTATHSDGSQLVVDATTLEYRPQEGYTGPDVISVEVVDGEDGEDTAVTAMLAIPVEVLPGETDLAPTFRGAVVEVELGGPVASVDLGASAEDPEDPAGTSLRYALGEFAADPEVEIAVDGSRLTARASATAAKGTILQVPVTVSDGANDPVEATFQVVVVGSTRPLPTTVLDVVEVHAGSSVSVPVLGNDANHFPEHPLELVDASRINGDGAVEVQGDQVVITPDAEFAGVFTATYTVQDGTGDPDRQVSGEIRATVLGKPKAPSAPRIGEVGDGFVEVQITAGDDNGSPITGYTVTSATGPPVSQECTSTSCTVTGLTNGSEYTFQVVAHNAVGDSPISAPSAVARPDVRPEAPGAPSAQRGDALVDVSWSPPVNRGSALQSYELQMQDTRSGRLDSRELGPDTTALTWDGLSNGTTYRFRVRASNLAEAPSEWSAWSQVVTPAGKPLAPTVRPTAERINGPLGGGVKVSWQALPADRANGEPVSAYVVRSSDGRSVRTGGSATTAEFHDLDPDASYSFTVAAVNAVSEGPAGPASETVTPFAVPTSPGNVRAELPTGDPAGPNGRATVTWDAADGRGTPVAEYVITWKGGSRTVGRDVTRLDVTGLTNGTSYVFTVQARNRFAGGESAPVQSNAVVPYTAPSAPSMPPRPYTCPTDTTTCSVTVDVAVGDTGGVPGSKAQFQVTGEDGSTGGWGDLTVDANGRAAFTVDEWPMPQTVTIETRTVNSEGLVSPITRSTLRLEAGMTGA